MTGMDATSEKNKISESRNEFNKSIIYLVHQRGSEDTSSLNVGRGRGKRIDTCVSNTSTARGSPRKNSNQFAQMNIKHKRGSEDRNNSYCGTNGGCGDSFAFILEVTNRTRIETCNKARMRAFKYADQICKRTNRRQPQPYTPHTD